MRTRANASERNSLVAVPDDEWLTVSQTAALLRCGRTTVFELMRAGTLPSAKPGRARLVKRADAVAYLERLRQP
jgi:excisionase family DNA binding protein